MKFSVRTTAKSSGVSSVDHVGANRRGSREISDLSASQPAAGLVESLPPVPTEVAAWHPACSSSGSQEVP